MGAGRPAGWRRRSFWASWRLCSPQHSGPEPDAMRGLQPRQRARRSSKIPGSYAVVIDPSMRDLSREIRPSSHACGPYTYPIAIGDMLVTSTRSMLNTVFEITSDRTNLPTKEDLARERLAGSILVKLDDFAPRLQCAQGFFAGTCTASTDVSIAVTVRSQEGTIFSTSASGAKTFDGSSGGACEGGAVVLSESITRSTKDALERLGERIANSNRLRDASPDRKGAGAKATSGL